MLSEPCYCYLLEMNSDLFGCIRVISFLTTYALFTLCRCAAVAFVYLGFSINWPTLVLRDAYARVERHTSTLSQMKLATKKT